MATVHTSLSQRLVLVGESWHTYLRLLRVFDERPHVRITYDRGTLEIMTLSPRHENIRCLFDPLVRTAVEELGLTLASYGSTTMKRRRQKRGLEPDQCYWIANEALVRGKTRFDFR